MQDLVRCLSTVGWVELSFLWGCLNRDDFDGDDYFDFPYTITPIIKIIKITVPTMYGRALVALLGSQVGRLKLARTHAGRMEGASSPFHSFTKPDLKKGKRVKKIKG